MPPDWLSLETWDRWATWSVRWLHAVLIPWLLVVLRFSGLMLFGPLFAPVSIPWNVRVLLILVLSSLITPNLVLLHDRSSITSWSADEEPEVEPAPQATPSGSTSPSHQPWSPLLLILAAAREVFLGWFLGLGVFTILSGIQLAGQIIDQQAGFGLGELIHPEFDHAGSPAAQFLLWLGAAVFVLWPPWGGPGRVLRTLLQSFSALPLGEHTFPQHLPDFVSTLIGQSMILALQMAVPLMLVMLLVDITLGFLGHAVPQINIQGVGFGLRAGLCLLMFWLIIPGTVNITERAMEASWEWLHQGLLASGKD
ncbi:MAG: hypothetical protein KatS3mg113_0648 [Planctomycetaceae bacterium]|nr:MAG: hypothetical protein KatS3mg113_0648 [Planctomycetaceae bacterium]